MDKKQTLAGFGKINFGAAQKNNSVSPEPTVINQQIIEQNAMKRILKNQQIHFIKAKQLSDLCSKPKENEQWRIITEKQFNAFALILHLLETENIEEMYLAIYRINQPTVLSLIDFIESGKIKQATFVISSFFQSTKRPEQWALMLKSFCDKSENCKHVYTHNHSKILAAKTANNEYYIFEGSGNMSDNARIEQYIYENNKDVFEFHKEWMSNITE